MVLQILVFCQKAQMSISNGSRGEFNGKFTAKICFPIGYFILPFADADIWSQKSLHTIDKYLDHMLVKF